MGARGVVAHVEAPIAPESGNAAEVNVRRDNRLREREGVTAGAVDALRRSMTSAPCPLSARVLFWASSAFWSCGAMIAAGACLLHQFHWIIYVYLSPAMDTGGALDCDRGRPRVVR
jgi:hypothetical protein